MELSRIISFTNSPTHAQNCILELNKQAKSFLHSPNHQVSNSHMTTPTLPTCNYLLSPFCAIPNEPAQTYLYPRLASLNLPPVTQIMNGKPQNTIDLKLPIQTKMSLPSILLPQEDIVASDSLSDSSSCVS